MYIIVDGSRYSNGQWSGVSETGLSSSAKIDRWFSLLPNTAPALSRPESGFVSGVEEVAEPGTLAEARNLLLQMGAKKKRRFMSAEESNDNRPIPNQNKTYVELFKFVPTKHSEDFTFTREDNASCLISEENSVVPTDATVKSKLVGLLAVKHKVEQQPDSPKLQEPHEMDNGTVSKFSQYEQNTYANDLEPMMQPQMPQLRERHDMESREVHVRGNFALYEPCLGDLLKPEFAELQKLKLEQTIDYISSQQFEYKQNMTRRPDLLIVRNLSGASNKKIYTLEELAGPIKPVVSQKHKSKFARKVDRMCEQFQGEEENNLQPDLIKLQNPYHVERKKVNIWDIIKQQKLYLTQPFRHQIAQYKFKLTQRLEPILEESETTLERLVEPELKQQLRLVKQNSDLGYYLNEYNLEQETESEVSHDEDYEESVVAASPLGSRTGENYYHFIMISHATACQEIPD
ncbi:uncharacterized protein LOC106717126 [Papilio machaon]|uniref:uncharacterized protein LOC106717126 n=1 Tax=Papilio machaon TaxID=76193 RepID=UPI001E662CFF|nr:uncharacterized protein LOC106717126 [Papilio machaon]